MLDEPKLVRAQMLARGALEKVKADEPTPVVVDHDMDRVVGPVREITVWDDVVSGTLVAPWFFTHCNLTEAPGWLRRGTSVSWSYKILHELEIAGTTLLRRVFIEEVSILSASRRPREPLAKVCLVERQAKPSGEVMYGKPGERLVRCFETPITVR